MKNHLIHFLLLTFLFGFISCKKDDMDPQEEENPCRPTSVIITDGPNSNSILGVNLLEPKGSDSIFVDFQGSSTQEDQIHKYTYDPNGLAKDLHVYESISGNLLGSIDMEWYAEGKKKTMNYSGLKFGVNGNSDQVFEYDIQQNLTYYEEIDKGNLIQKYNYLNQYNSNDQLLERIKLDLIENDTTEITTYAYDSGGNLLSTSLVKPGVFEFIIKTVYSYDAEDRVIETTTESHQNWKSVVKTAYSNGGLTTRKEEYDSSNAMVQYWITEYDKFQNTLSDAYYSPSNELRFQFEYIYDCTD